MFINRRFSYRYLLRPRYPLSQPSIPDYCFSRLLFPMPSVCRFTTREIICPWRAKPSRVVGISAFSYPPPTCLVFCLRLFKLFATTNSSSFSVSPPFPYLPPSSTAGVTTTLTSFLLTLSPQSYPSRLPIHGTHLAKYTISYTRLRQITLYT